MWIIWRFLVVSVCAVSQTAVSSEAEELEMKKEKYIHDLHQVLTGTKNSASYSFTLTPDPPNHSGTVMLTYEKMQKEISVSAACLMKLLKYEHSSCGERE